MVNLLPLRMVMRDLTLWRKDLQEPLELDRLTIQGLVDTRGISVLMIDMPDMCKVLDISLSCGYINYYNLPQTLRSKDEVTGVYKPKIFELLFSKIFHQDGRIFASPDTGIIFFLRQLLLLHKKVEHPCPTKNIMSAKREFFIIEESMRSPSLDWNLFPADFSKSASLSFHDANSDLPLFGERSVPKRLIDAMDFVSNLVVSQIPYLDPNGILPRHGPGSVSDLKTGTDKYLFPFWPEKLSYVFDFETFGVANYGCLPDKNPSSEEPPAKLIAVPKTLKSPRLIASEPTAHQFLQQGLLRWFRQNMPKLLRHSFDPYSQEPSKEGCLKNSITGSSATVDLSSASDRLSCWVIERFFRGREDILMSLYSVRTRVVRDDETGTVCILKKYANQGSAVTFVLQSIIYASICAAVVLFESSNIYSKRNVQSAFDKVRVFGDDIILPSSCVYSLDILMSYLGLKLNMGKTHINGKFRESCGTDAYDGDDVSPLYLSATEIKGGPSSLISWVDISNRAYRLGLWSLAKYMQDALPNKISSKLHVSHVPLGCLYLHTYQDGILMSGKRRFNERLFRHEYRGLTLVNRSVRGDRGWCQDLLHFFLSEARRKSSNDLFDRAHHWSVDNRVKLVTRWVSPWSDVGDEPATAP